MISIIIPAYNETRRLRHTIDTIDSFFSRRGDRFELIVVDDGSTDDTAIIADLLASSRPFLRVLHLAANQGKGAAVRTGVLASSGDTIFFLDADLSTPVEDWDRFRTVLADGADIAIGSRALRLSRISHPQPWHRVALGKTFNFLVRCISGLPFRDTQCGAKAFTSKAASLVFPSLTTTGFTFDVEILLAARQHNLLVREVPVHWRHHGESKVSIFRHTLPIILELVRLRARYPFRNPQRISPRR